MLETFDYWEKRLAEFGLSERQLNLTRPSGKANVCDYCNSENIEVYEGNSDYVFWHCLECDQFLEMN